MSFSEVVHTRNETKNAIQTKLTEARVGRLATTDEEGHPHIIPVCYVYDGQAFYTALDTKPKLVAPERLARVRHIQAQPTVALLIDEYQEDWRQLWYVLIRGTAALLSETDRGEQAKARRLLKAKYPSYDAGLLPDGALIIRILPTRITSWGKL